MNFTFYGTETMKLKVHAQLFSPKNIQLPCTVYRIKPNYSEAEDRNDYLRSDKQFDGILENPKKNINYYLDLLKCKISLLFHKIQINK